MSLQDTVDQIKIAIADQTSKLDLLAQGRYDELPTSISEHLGNRAETGLLSAADRQAALQSVTKMEQVKLDNLLEQKKTLDNIDVTRGNTPFVIGGLGAAVLVGLGILLLRR